MSKQVCVSLDESVFLKLQEIVSSDELPNGSLKYSSKSEFISSLISERYDQFILERAWYVCDGSLESFISCCIKLDSFSNFRYRNRRFFELYFESLQNLL